MEVKAVQKNLLISPKKLREVVLLIKDLTPQEALDKLPFVRKRGSKFLSKVIKQAISNASQLGVKTQDLIFRDIQINEGPRLKRWQFAARGRVKPYKRRMSHIRIVLTTDNKKEKVKENKNIRKLQSVKKVKRNVGGK